MKMNEGGSDPKLKIACLEITEILKKHDILATMLLVSPTHSEFLFHIESSWSVMKFEPFPDSADTDAHFLRFKSKKEDYPSREAQDYATESTVHALTSFLQFGRLVQTNMDNMLKLLKTKMKIAYEVWDSPFKS